MDILNNMMPAFFLSDQGMFLGMYSVCTQDQITRCFFCSPVPYRYIIIVNINNYSSGTVQKVSYKLISWKWFWRGTLVLKWKEARPDPVAYVWFFWIRKKSYFFSPKVPTQNNNTYKKLRVKILSEILLFTCILENMRLYPEWVGIMVRIPQLSLTGITPRIPVGISGGCRPCLDVEWEVFG